MATAPTESSNSREKRGGGLIRWVIGIVALLVIVGPIVVSNYTDFLWFDQVDFRGVFTTVIISRIILFVVFALIGGLIAWAATYFTWRFRPTDVDSLLDADRNSPVQQYRQIIERSLRVVLIALPVIVGLITGFVGQGNWRTVMLWWNRTPFNSQDAQFGKDLSFYAFELPMYRLGLGTVSMLLVIAFVISLIGFYLLGAIRVGNQAAGVKGRVTNAALVQLSVIGGMWILTRVVGFWLDRYDLLTNAQENFRGASYTDINAVLPAKIILMIIGIVVAIAFFSVIVLKDLRIPAMATVLMVVSALVVGTAWPMLLERFSVQPNRAAKEREYIERNIESTREAFGLTDDKVTRLDNWGSQASGESAREVNAKVASDNSTISNIRLLDPDVLTPTFTQQQQLRNFYGFPDTLSVDRYNVDGEMRDFVVAARELDPNALQENQAAWINRHTVYTHGNGFVAAQANQVDEVARDVGSTRGGYPVYTVSDLQANEAGRTEAAEEIGIKVDQPRVYFGPVIASAADGADYAVVGQTGDQPVEYDTDASSYTYTGDGGVDIGNWFNRLAFAAKYQEMNLILSDRVGGDSKIIFDRDPRQRVEKVAPWLTTDSSTYPAVIDGRIKWIVDGYTTLSELPYSTQTSLTDATEDTLNPEGTEQRLISNDVGYIRNSVKATVDAYDGTVDLYEFDENDPVLKAWEGVFPDTVKPRSEISDELEQHLRYPEDLFKVQRELLARYHVDDPGVFFTNDAFWSVPGDPTAPEGREALAQPPYYVVAADAETGDPSFQMITPYRGLQREFLSAHMSVSSDPDNYGQITLRVLPTDTQTQGPKQAQDTMMSSDQISRDRTLWEGTNTLHNGNLLTLPVGDEEILYVEPVYSQRRNQESAFPKLLRVLVSYKGQIGYAPTISEALSQVGIDPKEAQDLDEVDGDSDPVTADDEGASRDDDDRGGDRPSGASAPAGGSGSEGDAIGRINDALEGLESARDGSFEEYGRALDRLDDAVESYRNSQRQ